MYVIETATPVRMTGVAKLTGFLATATGADSWRKITPQEIDAFAEVTGELEWVHGDPAGAAAAMKRIFARTEEQRSAFGVDTLFQAFSAARI